jgi:CheY-like chemotaxis protein
MDQIRILLAEDNPVNQKVAELMLRRIGYEIDIESNGQEAIESLKKNHHHIVLMDAHMPVMDGLAATRWIRKHIKLEHQPKVFVMTATLMTEARDAWKDIDVDGFIEKPVRVEILKRQIDEVVQEIRNAGKAGG